MEQEKLALTKDLQWLSQSRGKGLRVGWGRLDLSRGAGEQGSKGTLQLFCVSFQRDTHRNTHMYNVVSSFCHVNGITLHTPSYSLYFALIQAHLRVDFLPGHLELCLDQLSLLFFSFPFSFFPPSLSPHFLPSFFFSNGFIEIQLTYHAIHRFKAHSSVALSTFTESYNITTINFLAFSWPQKKPHSG